MATKTDFIGHEIQISTDGITWTTQRKCKRSSGTYSAILQVAAKFPDQKTMIRVLTFGKIVESINRGQMGI